jgi:glyoxylase-like metal-dependent hydrolase (beta-lactamase superfamily II)
MKLQPGLTRHESTLWEGASTLLIDGPSALAIDPGILPDEVARMAAAAAAAGAQVRDILVTHADWDHLAGLSAFPSATVWMTPLSAARVRSGEADGALAGDARGYGIPEGVTARVDRELEPGRATRVGAFTVESLAVPGHRQDGVAYRVRSHGVLVVGDYLSSYECPGVKFSSAAFRTTLALLIDTLEHDPPAAVIPGHGPAHDAAAALQVAREDLGYLHAIQAAVLAGPGGRDEARARGLALPWPRGEDEDDAESHAENVERQLDEVFAPE